MGWFTGTPGTDALRTSFGRCRRQWLLVVLLLWACAPAGAAEPRSAGLPEAVRTRSRAFTIPFRLPKSEDPDPDAVPQRVMLQASKDLGATWRAAGETAPSSGSFTYKAEADGEYWFRLRAVDRKGRTRGGEGPDVRVLVDAAGPRLAARVWKGADGEIMCRYAAADDSLRLESLKVEYKQPGDAGWKTLAAQAILARESPAHLVGEEIWWAGEKVGTLAVRITVADASGNQTVRQFTLEQSDPRVDQTALADEIGVPPLPADGQGEFVADIGAGASADPGPGSSPVTNAPVADAPVAGRWRSEVAGTWSDGQPTQRQTATQSVPAQTAVAALLPRANDRGEPRQPAPTPAPVTGLDAAAAGAGQAEYRGRPLHLTKSRRFTWDYEAPAPRPAAGGLRAELWTTRDGGVTWQQTAVDHDGRSPIEVSLPEQGLFGVRLEMVAEAAGADGSPRSGDTPDAWVGVDEQPPEVDIVAVTRDESDAGDALLIRYACRDPLIVPRSVRLLYSPNAEGPWATIAESQENQGEHRWQPGRTVPSRVYVRIEASDAAGNIGGTTTPESVSVAAARFGGKLGGLRALPVP